MARPPEVLAAAQQNMSTLRDFIAVYRMYREHHSCAYSIRMAWGIAVLRLPF